MRSSCCYSGDAESLSFQGWRAELARGSDSRRLLSLTMDYVSEIFSVRGACTKCWDIPDLRPWRWVIAGTRLLGALSENRKMHSNPGRIFSLNECSCDCDCGWAGDLEVLFLVPLRPNLEHSTILQLIWKRNNVIIFCTRVGWLTSPFASPANRIVVQAVILTVISDANTQICMIHFLRWMWASSTSGKKWNLSVYTALITHDYPSPYLCSTNEALRNTTGFYRKLSNKKNIAYIWKMDGSIWLSEWHLSAYVDFVEANGIGY